jgi:hypothetical protein
MAQVEAAGFIRAMAAILSIPWSEMLAAQALFLPVVVAVARVLLVFLP